MRSSILARIPGFRQRIIPEPHVPSRGSQARGTRLATGYAAFSYPEPSYARSATRELQIEHAQCLTGYHVFMVSGLGFARAPRR
jgi:hypothetical protein